MTLKTLGWCAALILAALALTAQRQAPPPLPDIPGTPVMSGVTYPDCRNEYRVLEEDHLKGAEITRCVQALDAYHDEVLADFRLRMIAHQEAMATLYESEVQNNFDYTQAQADDFFARVTAEHEASNPDGRHFEVWRALASQYQRDRSFLTERFCRYGECDNPVASNETEQRDREDREALAAARGEDARERRERRDRRRRNRNRSCDGSRGIGGILGGILGGIVGEATGIGAAAGFAAGAFSGVLVAEVACQLQPEEQEELARVTEEVTAQEEVGATAEWVSPSREGVSGSSTVTALVSQPNGTSCMDVTDVIIVDGEETRVSKRMCRARGESRYTLAA